MIPYAYQIGIPLFFLAVAGVGVLYINAMSSRLDREEREARKAREAPPAP